MSSKSPGEIEDLLPTVDDRFAVLPFRHHSPIMAAGSYYPSRNPAGTSLASHLGEPIPGKLFRTLSWNGRPQSEWRMTGGEMVFRSLPPGGWTVTVAATDGRSWTGESTTSPGASALLRLE